MNMFAKITTILLFFAICTFANWTGSTSEPESMKKIDGKPFYVITSADELAWFAAQVNNGSSDINAVLGNDIVFGNDKNTVGTVSWSPIGYSEEKQFAGVFDGAGYTIYGLYVKRPTIAGFIGYLAKSGIVKNVYVDKGTISVELSSKPYAGGLVAINYGIVQKSKNLNSVSNNQNPYFLPSSEKNIYSGGIVGLNEGLILDCNNGGKILAKSKNIAQPVSFAGGIAGYNTGEIHNSSNQGYVISEDTTESRSTLKMTSYSGGITGYNSGSISNCHNSQDINSKAKSYLSNTESNSESVDVQAMAYSGGIAGYNSGNVFKCYNEASKIYSGSYSYAKSGRDGSPQGCVVGGSTGAHSYSYSGGISGYNSGDIYDCYSDYAGSASTYVFSEYYRNVSGWCEEIDGYKYSQSYYDGIVGWNASGGHTKSSWYRTEYWLNNTKVVGAAENMRKDQFAWILNTCNGTEENSGVWTRGTEGYPTFANEDSLAIYKIVFNDDGAKSNRYTNYQGVVSFPDNPEPAEGYVFSGWFNSEDVKVKPSTIFNADETVNAVYVDASDVFWTINFYNAAPADTVLESKSYQHGSIVTYGGVTPTLASTAQYTYTFKGWNVEPTNAAEDFDYLAVYDSTIRSYTVTFNNTDGSEIERASFEYGQIPSCTKTPTRDATAEWTYSHKGWKPALDYVTETVSYTAIYDSSKIEYKVTFLNGTTVIDEQMVSYGDAAIAPTDVIRDGYRFVGWNTTFSNITENLTVKALFEEIAVYAVKVVGLNGEMIDSVGVEENGRYVLPTAPQKDGYDFIGFYKGKLKAGNPGSEIVVNENTSINAVYEIKTFVVKFVNGSTELQSEELAYGNLPKYKGDIPAKNSTVQWTYSFKGWNPELSSVTESAIYTAVFDSVLNKYEVSFNDYDGSVLKTVANYDYGTFSTNIVKPKNPIRQETAKYIYTFKGWDPVLADVTEDVVYIAKYDSSIRDYQIVFVNGNDELQSENVTYGDIPAYNGTVPTKQATARWTYTFKGWTPAITSVVGSATYAAVFDSVVNKYEVVFKDYDGSVLKKAVKYDYGTASTNIVKPVSPTRQETAKCAYTFKDWDPVLADVTENVVYIAEYDCSIRSYTITFVNDLKELQSSKVAYGISPSYKGETPTKNSTARYAYTFKGWNPSIESVTQNATYKAVFDSTVKNYTVMFMNGSKTLQTINVAYGSLPKYTSATPTKTSTKNYSYEFAGWSPKIEKVTGEATYQAVFDSTKLTGIMDNRFADLEMSVSVISRNIQISAAPVGSTYAILDMQGRVLKNGRVESVNFNIAIQQAGNYLVRIGGKTQVVNVK